MRIDTGNNTGGFLSTLSLRRATREPTALRTPHQRFLSTLSLRRATARRESRQQPAGISIHALLAESDQAQGFKIPAHSISIHALLAESDNQPGKSNKLAEQFLSTLSLRRATQLQKGSSYPPIISIHALLAESDDTESARDRPKEKFLSTLSLRRATIRQSREKPRQTNFYPRSPCGERLPAVPCRILRMLFLSTLSLRRAT